MTSLLAKFILQKMDESVVPPWIFSSSLQNGCEKNTNFPGFCRQNCQVGQLNLPDADGNSPMKLAVDGKHWEVVRHGFCKKNSRW